VLWSDLAQFLGIHVCKVFLRKKRALFAYIQSLNE
jgi:hypothetical protein